jgi:hypothetical protein
MSNIPKNERKQPKKPNAKEPTPAAPGIALDVDMSGLSETAAQLEAIHRSLWSYNMNATTGENSLNLFTGENSYPLRLVLEGDAVDSIADSLKRIADAMAARRADAQAGTERTERRQG